MRILTPSKKPIVLIVLLLITTVSCVLLQGSNKKPTYEGIPFKKYNTLKGTGFKKESMETLTKYLQDSSETTGMVVLYKGKVIYEYGDIEEVSYIASCRKSVLSMLYGKYVFNGIIDLEENIGSIGIDEDDGLLSIEKEATVDHIITSRSGVFHVPSNGGYDEEHILKRGSVKPGEYFVYNNWDFNVAGAILEMKTGNSVYEEIEEQLAIPLGFQDWNIKNQKRKVNTNKSRYSAYHIYISTRDMAKIGQLMFNKGQWQGKQLIPEEWIQKTITAVTPVDTVNKRRGKDKTSTLQFSYGYMWWLIDHFEGYQQLEGGYSASGYGGQFISIFPQEDLVIAHKAKLDFLTLWGLKPGGVSDGQYWLGIVKKVIDAKN